MAEDRLRAICEDITATCAHIKRQLHQVLWLFILTLSLILFVKVWCP
jgi:hypothetical protein